MMPSSSSSQPLTPARTAWWLLVLLAMPATAHAYIDPGTGSLLFQSLLAVLFGVGVAFRRLKTVVARVWAFLLRRPRQDDPGE